MILFVRNLSFNDAYVSHLLFLRRDMAEIVETQGGKIDEIHTATEVSHERAKAGLEQVKQAAAYQNSCLISWSLGIHNSRLIVPFCFNTFSSV